MERTEFSPAGRSPRQPPGMLDPTDPAVTAHASSDARVTALRAALQAQLYAQLLGKSPDGDLRRTVRLLCDDAHRQHLPVEQLIIALKHVWHSLPEVRQLPPHGIEADLLSSVVSLTIEEFYARRD
jgi:hypothetical protein